MSEEWRSRAKCQGVDTNWFFPPDGLRGIDLARFIRAAQAVCETCPVRGECLTYARDNHTQYGVWGGQDMAHDKFPTPAPITQPGHKKPYARICAGGCGRMVATLGAMRPGYLRISAHGMCSSCLGRIYRARRRHPSQRRHQGATPTSTRTAPHRSNHRTGRIPHRIHTPPRRTHTRTTESHRVMILTRDLETPLGCFSAGTTVQPVARTDADEWIVRLLPGWTVTLDKDAVRKTRRPTRTCIICKHETLRPAYCPDCEIIAVRMQVRKGRAA